MHLYHLLLFLAMSLLYLTSIRSLFRCIITLNTNKVYFNKVFSSSLISKQDPYKNMYNYYSTTRISLSNISDGDSSDTVISICSKKIQALLNPVKLSVTSTNDDPNGSHIQVMCISEEFTGKSTLQRQRLVYKAIWEELNGPVHAVDSIIAKTPKEMGL